MSELRPQVAAFAQLMEQKLRKHDDDRGTRGWSSMTPMDLCWRLDREVDELKHSLCCLGAGSDLSDVAGECADVANFAMMIIDVLEQLENEDEDAQTPSSS